VCSKITNRFFSVTEYPEDPKFPLCHRHHSEIEKIGWFMACEKYDFLAIYLSAWGFFFGVDEKAYYKPDKTL
jgi:hypothetical protein